jgi:hypothetical protein
MINRMMLYLSGFAAAVSLVFAATMIFSSGHADMNYYGEGWVEVALAGSLAVVGCKKAVV